MLVVQSVILSVGIGTFGYVKNVIGRFLYNGGGGDTSEEKKVIELNIQKTFVCTLDEFGLKFWPPLYMQRYMIVQEILEHPIWNGSIKKVLDYGCAELGFFKCIKPVPGLNKIMLVDIDFNTLDINQTKVLPTNYDYISMSERKEPMTVDIYNGSIADLDDRMLGVDAVICIELIEHLCPDVLSAVPYTVFEFIKPMLAVFTTPNVEFNILFPNFTTQFRHYDHKFEWTRKQFNKWARNIISRYPEYAVQFDGIGVGPNGTENLGCCSQMAIFYRKDMKTSPVNPIGSTPYKLLRRVTYPFEHDDDDDDYTIKQQTIYEKLRNVISKASSNTEYIIDDNIEIPLNIIFPHFSDCCSSIDELENVIGKMYETKLNEHGEWLLIKPISEISLEEYILNSSVGSNHSGQEDSLLEDEVNNHDDKGDWNVSADMHFSESKLCYSTPMTKNQGNYFNSVDNSNTVFSNSGLYKTAVDHSRSENVDMDISSSCSGNINVDDCEVYQDFVVGRNNSMNEEDISGIEKTLICDIHGFSDDSCKTNNNIINDNTVIQNDILSLKNNCNVDIVNKLKLKNDNDSNDEIQEQMCLNRTLLDESGYTENLLSTPNK